MNDIRIKNDLGHPLCDNIRQGDWLCGYIANRLQVNPGTKEVITCCHFIFGKAFLKSIHIHSWASGFHQYLTITIKYRTI